MYRQTASLLLSVSLAAGFFFMVSIKQAHAYIELGSLSFMIQFLIAAAFGGLFTLKVMWHRIIGKLSRLFALIKGTKIPLD